MKTFLTILFVLGLASLSYADRVCIEKNSGKLIEYQSGDFPLGTLVQNAINAGYKKNEVEEKYVTKSEWAQIREVEIDKPARDKAKAKEDARKIKEEAIKAKLNLTAKEFSDLKEVLGD